MKQPDSALNGGNNEFHKLLKKRMDQLDKEVVAIKEDNVKLRAEVHASSRKALVTANTQGFEKVAKAIGNRGGLTSDETDRAISALNDLKSILK